MLRASLRACSTLSRVAALAVPRPPLLAAASVRDRPSSSLQSWSVAPPPSETPPREPLLLGGLLGACLPRCPPPRPMRTRATRGAPCAVAGLALDLPSSQGRVEQMEMGRGPRRTGKQWEHLVKTRKFVKCAPPPPRHMRPPLLAPPLLRPHLRPPSALRAPWAHPWPSTPAAHTARGAGREALLARRPAPTLCPHLADPWRSCRSKEMPPAASSSGGDSAWIIVRVRSDDRGPRGSPQRR